MSQASSRLLGAFRMAEPLTSRLPSLPGLPQRLKGGRIERGGKYVFNYWKQVAIDYKAALGEVYTGALAKPKKAALISSFLASCAYMNKTNPTFRDFEDRWREFNILLIGVSEAIRNKESAKHFEFLDRVDHHEHRLQYTSFGVFSILWKSDFSEDCKLFSAQCEYLQPGYLDYYDRIVDVGWLGKWWILEKKMEDMDVNPEEWLPDGRPAHPENQFWKSAL